MAHSLGTVTARANSSGNPISVASVATTLGDTVLVLLIKTVGNAARAGGSPSWMGRVLTQASTTQIAATNPEASAELWYLLNPPVATGTLTIPNTNAQSIFYTIARARAAAGGRSAFEAANGGNATSTNPTPGAVTITQAGSIVFAITAGGWTTFTSANGVTASGTSIAITDDGTDGGGEQYSLNPAIGSFTLSWTFGTSDDWGAVVASFKEVPPPTFNNYLGFSAQSAGIVAVSEKIR